jgi:hypothetical protein
VFLDDDAVAASDWLERLRAVYVSHPRTVAVSAAARRIMRRRGHRGSRPAATGCSVFTTARCLTDSPRRAV